MLLPELEPELERESPVLHAALSFLSSLDLELSLRPASRRRMSPSDTSSASSLTDPRLGVGDTLRAVPVRLVEGVAKPRLGLVGLRGVCGTNGSPRSGLPGREMSSAPIREVLRLCLIVGASCACGTVAPAMSGSSVAFSGRR